MVLWLFVSWLWILDCWLLTMGTPARTEKHEATMCFPLPPGGNRNSIGKQEATVFFTLPPRQREASGGHRGIPARSRKQEVTFFVFPLPRNIVTTSSQHCHKFPEQPSSLGFPPLLGPTAGISLFNISIKMLATTNEQQATDQIHCCPAGVDAECCEITWWERFQWSQIA